MDFPQFSVRDVLLRPSAVRASVRYRIYRTKSGQSGGWLGRGPMATFDEVKLTLVPGHARSEMFWDVYHVDVLGGDAAGSPPVTALRLEAMTYKSVAVPDAGCLRPVAVVAASRETDAEFAFRGLRFPRLGDFEQLLYDALFPER